MSSFKYHHLLQSKLYELNDGTLANKNHLCGCVFLASVGTFIFSPEIYLTNHLFFVLWMFVWGNPRMMWPARGVVVEKTSDKLTA